MELSAARLVLRDFLPDDAPAFVAYHADPGFLAYYDDAVATPEHARALVARFIRWAAETPRRNYQLAIVERASDALVGCGGLRTAGLAAGRAEFGLEIAPDAWGRGFGTEAARTLLAFGFETLGLDEATGHAVTQNARVAALVRKLGFREGPTTPGEKWMTDRGWTVTTWTLTRAAWGDPLQ